MSEVKKSSTKEDNDFILYWESLVGTTSFHMALNIAFDKFKSQHITGRLHPHLHLHNQTSIQAVREFIDLFIEMGINAEYQIPEAEESEDGDLYDQNYAKLD